MAHTPAAAHPGGQASRPPSLHQQAFRAFDAGQPPEAVTRSLNAKPATIERYHCLWRHRPLARRVVYRLVQALRKGWPLAKAEVAADVATALHISQAEAQAHLERPWAWHQLLSGRWRSWRTKRPC